MLTDPANLRVLEFQYEALNEDLQEVRLVRFKPPSSSCDDAELSITMDTVP